MDQILRLTPRRVILAGVGAILLGFLYQVGAAIYDHLDAWLSSPSLPSLDQRFMISVGLVIVGIIAILYGVYAMKQRPVLGVNAYLFFPKNTNRDNLTLEFHKNNFLHRALVNLKTNPPAVYYLTPDSYGWRLVESQGRSITIIETDTDPTEPITSFLQKWCKEKGYFLRDNIPDREALLAEGSFNLSQPLDPSLGHLWHEEFAPFYCWILPISGIPHRRILLNKSTMKAFPLSVHDWEWCCSGRVEGHTGIAGLRRRHAQKWAKEKKFDWIDFPTKDDWLTKEAYEEKQMKK